LNSGRTWWAYSQFAGINTTPTFLSKKIEDLRETGAGRDRARVAIDCAAAERLPSRSGRRPKVATEQIST
jgi:hypothetical protein